MIYLSIIFMKGNSISRKFGWWTHRGVPRKFFEGEIFKFFAWKKIFGVGKNFWNGGKIFECFFRTTSNLNKIFHQVGFVPQIPPSYIPVNTDSKQFDKKILNTKLLLAVSVCPFYHSTESKVNFQVLEHNKRNFFRSRI